MKKIILSLITIILCSIIVYMYFNKEQDNVQNNNISNKEEILSKNADVQNIVREDLWTNNADKRIYGVITAPKNYKELKLPTIIYSHGFNNTHSYGDFYANELAKLGYIVYSFDFSGGSPRSKSDGDILQMSVFTEQYDLNAVLNNMLSQNFVDKNNLFLLGASQGGVVSTLVAAENNDKIKGLILLYPAFVLFDDAKNLFSSIDEIPEIYNHKGNNVGKVYFEKTIDYDIYKTIEQYKNPTLIIHGDKDNIVPLSYSENAVNTFENAELKIIKGANHIFTNKDNLESLPYIKTFLKENIT